MYVLRVAFEAEFYGEFARPGLFADPTVRAAFQDEFSCGRFEACGFNGAAEAAAGLVKLPVDVSAGETSEFKLVCGGEAADASADDGNTLHAWPSKTCAIARTSVCESLRLAARKSARPSGAAKSRKLMSMS